MKPAEGVTLLMKPATGHLRVYAFLRAVKGMYGMLRAVEDSLRNERGGGPRVWWCVRTNRTTRKGVSITFYEQPPTARRA